MIRGAVLVRTGLALAAAVTLAVACGTPQQRPAPPTPAGPPPADVQAFLDDDAPVPLDSGPPRLLPYLEQYPLGNRGRRKDLLASDDRRSMHLVQLSLPLPEHTHPERTEIAYVLRGRGLVRIDGRGYPAAPGAAFRIDAGTPHSVLPDEGETLIAIVYYDPPLLEGDDSVPVR